MTLNKQNGRANSLINETSPYLLQHAYNPVDWKPWNEETLALAKKEDKPILVSIGYSACHWCHVMEHESFEDESIAKIMNAHFVCVKVDREERPDVDQLYMNAAQIITGGGGWPLNCFALPDGKPFYAGTYYPKENWGKLLERVNDEFETNRSKLEDYASKLLGGIQQTSTLNYESGFAASKENVLRQVDRSVIQWSQRFDQEHGGSQGAPKFPLPNNQAFLLRYGYHFENKPVENFVHLSLTKMARGGIYDQIGGGFARYSVDNQWKLPHFEKMLYDNAQLLELYASAYKRTKNLEYLSLVEQTASFLTADMFSAEGAFYSAYDADSEGVEGKYYVWKKSEIQSILGDDFDLCEDYYGVDNRGFWEDGNYILLRNETSDVLLKHGITALELEQKVTSINERLIDKRKKRVHPGLDDKSLTNWNALMVSGFLETYQATGNKIHLDQAKKVLMFIDKTQTNDDHSLWHSYKNGVSTIHGFLEDYACVIQAYLDMFSTTGEITWALKSNDLCQYVIHNFHVEESGFFNFTSHGSTDLKKKNVDYFDNVIPSSNSIMCRNLIRLSRLFLNKTYRNIAVEMINRIAPKVVSYGSGFSNWMNAILDECHTFNEVVIVGEKAEEFADSFRGKYLPNCLIVTSANGEGLPIFADRLVEGKTLIYVCHDNACQAPVDSVEDALLLLKK